MNEGCGGIVTAWNDRKKIKGKYLYRHSGLDVFAQVISLLMEMPLLQYEWWSRVGGWPEKVRPA